MTASAFAVPGRMPQQLIEYWVHGKGAAKIRWGTPGDFNRCVRNLAKYFPRNPQGLCNRLHTRALGQPPGQGHAVETEQFDLEALSDDLLYEDEAALVPMRKMWRGTLAPINKPTGDRRRFETGAISYRDLPLPLLWQRQTGDGHSDAVIVGRILYALIDDERVYGEGDWLDTPEAYQAQELVKAGVLHPSVDLDSVDFELRVADGSKFDPEQHCSEETHECERHEFVVTEGRVSAATLVAIPAFAEAKLELYDGPDEEGLMAAFDELPLAVEDESECGCGMTAAAIQSYICPVVEAEALVAAAFGDEPARPPAHWFEDPHLQGEMGWTVEPASESGLRRVYGYIAAFGQCHMGFPGECREAPHSTTGYALFLQGKTMVEEGHVIRTGPLFYGGKHASLTLGLRAAAQHYDDTSRQFAHVAVGEDEYGVWFAGYVPPGIDEAMLVRAMGCGLSGDWRPYGVGLEMIAALAINAAGFPGVTRQRVVAGERMALIASGGIPYVVDDDPIYLRGSDGVRYLDGEAMRELVQSVLSEREAHIELRREAQSTVQSWHAEEAAELVAAFE